MKILYVQFAGDFSESYNRLVVQAGAENYYGQKYSVDAVVDKSTEGHIVKVIVLHGEKETEAQLTETLFSQTFAPGNATFERTCRAILDFAPDRVILRYPSRRLLTFLRKKRIPTLLTFAHSFDTATTFRTRVSRFLIARELRQGFFRWIANHQINACRSLARLGVKADKILPYDWEHPNTPEEWPRSGKISNRTKKIRLFFAGSLQPIKGIHELVAAARDMNAAGRDIELTIAGKGDFAKICETLNIPEDNSFITYLGFTPHADVLGHMHRADFVVVPSHHDFPEGLPMTIMESLMVGTPVIASDHPMFVGRVGKRGAVRFFREKNADDLARVIAEVFDDEKAFDAAIENTGREWHDLVLDLKWADLVSDWINAPDDVDFSRYSLRSLKTE